MLCLLMALYEIRKQPRCFRHVGAMSMPITWTRCRASRLQLVVAELLVRVFHNARPAEAIAIADASVERSCRDLDHRRHTACARARTLHEGTDPATAVCSLAGWVNETDLVTAIEHSNALPVYRRDVLATAHMTA